MEWSLDGQGDEGKANIVLQNRARILMKLRRYTEAVQDFKRAGIGGTILLTFSNDSTLVLTLDPQHLVSCMTWRM